MGAPEAVGRLVGRNCSPLQLSDGRLPQCRITVHVMGVEDGPDLLQAVAVDRRDFRNGGASDGEARKPDSARCVPRSVARMVSGRDLLSAAYRARVRSSACRSGALGGTATGTLVLRRRTRRCGSDLRAAINPMVRALCRVRAVAGRNCRRAGHASSAGVEASGAGPR